MCELNIDSMSEEALAAINDNLPRCCAGYECTEIDNTGNKFCVESGKAKAKAGEACSVRISSIILISIKTFFTDSRRNQL